jgi:excinuclease ABC subunit C
MNEAGAIEPFDAKRFLKTLPLSPGVYQMYDAAGGILYVGKAKQLKNRVSSYFHKADHSAKTQALVKRIARIDVTVTPSEAEALVLEQNLIKAERPPFNILMRDDKSYPYILLTDAEPFPRLALHRGTKKFRGRYFGPFPNSQAVRESLAFLQKTFGVRQCEDSVFRNRSRPCLQHQIGRCPAPCVGLVSQDDYAQAVRHTQLFLEGRNAELQASLAEEMTRESAALRFEVAAQLRDQIAALSAVQAQATVEAGSGDCDILAARIESGKAAVHVLFVRDGRMQGSKHYPVKNPLETDPADLLTAFLPQLYASSRQHDIPPELVVSHSLSDQVLLERFLSDLAGRKVQLNDAVRTHRARWLAMAIEAVTQNLQAVLAQDSAQQARLSDLAQVLGLESVPEWIECFDISHSSGEATKASCVVFNQDGPVKSRYRQYNIEGVKAGDDYAAMHQVLSRRYSRLQRESSGFPDLILIDGGKGQLRQALSVLADLGLSSLMAVGIAKGTTRKPGFETLIRPDFSELVLQNDSPALHVLQRIRDEAHRFAITGHRAARDKKRKQSSLDAIPGIGPSRRRQLLQHFGGLAAVKAASLEDLMRVSGISRALAETIYGFFNEGFVANPDSAP